jgi:hypothetical protein
MAVQILVGSLSGDPAYILLDLPRRAEIVQMMNVRRVGGFLGKQVIDARHGSLFAFQRSERQRAGFLKCCDGVSAEIIMSIGHSCQRLVRQIVSGRVGWRVATPTRTTREQIHKLDFSLTAVASRQTVLALRLCRIVRCQDLTESLGNACCLNVQEQPTGSHERWSLLHCERPRPG